MATTEIVTTSYVSTPDEDDSADPEAIVRDALATSDAIYLVEVTRTSVLLSK